MAINSFFSLLWLSGISSDTTTYIMAPAAKERKNGKSILAFKTSAAPNTPNIGSTIADSPPYINDLNLGIPSLIRGIEIADPSGKFWIPMPTANMTALINVAPFIP